MKKPTGNDPTVTVLGDSQIWRCHRLDCSILGNGFQVARGSYVVGSFQIVDEVSALSTGVISAMVSNSPDGSITVAHPSAVTKSAAGISTTFPLETPCVGVEVTTAQAGVVVCVYLALSK